MKEFRWYFSEFCSPWLKKILNFDIPKSVKMKEFRWYFSEFCSPWLMNLEFQYPEIHQNERIHMILLWSSFTIVEENYKFQPFQMLQIDCKKFALEKEDWPSDVFVSAIRFSLWSEKGSPWDAKMDILMVWKMICLRSRKWS